MVVAVSPKPSGSPDVEVGSRPIARISLAGVKAHPGRFASLTFAVFIGVLFIAATLTITDTVQAGFRSLFSNAYRNVSVVVREQSNVVRQNQTFRGRIDANLADTARDAPGVAAAEPRIAGYAYIVSARGKAPENVTSDTAGSPVAENWVDDDQLNPYTLVAGTKPIKPGDVVIDRGTAKSSAIAVGETVSVVSKDGASPGRVVGVVRFGSVDSPGAVPVVLFTLADAQELLGEEGRIDAVLVRGTNGTSDTALAASLQNLLPTGVESVTGKTVTKESENQVANGLRFITAFLLIFAVLSLIVGAFIIANTFAISISQRTRELALLRAVGASRAQIRRMMLGEALAMSIVGSLSGLFGGIALAAAMKSILRATGVDLPPSPVVVRPATIAWSLGIGLIVTIGAAATPAWRAARISPIAAMRDSEFEPPPLLRRTVLGLAVTIIGALIMRSGANLPSLPRTGQGAALLLLGSILLAPAIGTLLRVLVEPAGKVFGNTTGLAVRNTTRNPRRTASTALALSLGSAVACFAVILNASLQSSLSTAVAGGLRGDLVVRSGSFGTGGLPVSVASSIAALPSVEAASGLRYGFATVDGPKRKARRPSAVSRSGGRPIASFNPRSADRLLDFGREQGKFSDLDTHADGAPSNIAISRRELDDHGWKVGDTIKLTFPGKPPAPFRISTVYTQGIAFDFGIANEDYEKYVPDVFDFVVYVAAKPGVSIDKLRTEIATLTTAYPTAKVEDPKQYVKRITGSLDQLLSLILGLLVLVVVVAVLGIAITLSLSVVERVREIGLLRTLGMQRGQIRSMLRSEAILISLFAVTIGVVLGTAVSKSLLKALRDEGLSTFVFPPLGVASLALLAAVAGLIASLAPGRRAARLPMLSALSGLHEAPVVPPVPHLRFKRAVRIGIVGALIAAISGFTLGRSTAPQASSTNDDTYASSNTTAAAVTATAGGSSVPDGTQGTTDPTGAQSPASKPSTILDSGTSPSTPDGLVGGTGPDALQVSNLPYKVPVVAGDAKAGRLLSATSIIAPTGLKAWRVLYDSTVRDEQPVIVSGLVFAPDRPAPKGGWPVVSFAHPTNGFADRCAPSRNIGILENTVATLVGQLNMVAVASDYPGLGTAGPHPFLDGISSGRSVLDIATAAATIDGLQLAPATILWGHSQGGHAALWAASQAPTYASNLEIRGVLAGAAPSQLRTLVDGLEKTPDRGYASLIAKGLQSVNPSLKLTEVLSPRGIELTEQLEEKCSGEVNENAQRDTVQAGTPLPTAWLEALDANEPGQSKINAPILLIHGEIDELVPVGSSKTLQDQLVALGSKVERKVYPGAGHADVVLTSLTDSIAWIAKQAAAPSNGSGVPVSPNPTNPDAAASDTGTAVDAAGVRPTVKAAATSTGAFQQWPGAKGLLKAALDRGQKKPLVIAHAGGDLEAPHSTMYAFKRAVALGAEVLELDVRLAKDGVVIVQHDPLLDRTASENGPAVARTAAELAKIDNAYWFTGGCWDCRTSGKVPPFRGVRTGKQKPPAGYSADDFGISTLQEVMQQFPDLVIDIEIKTDGPDGGSEVAVALAKLLNADPKPDRFIVVSFDDAALVTFRKAAPTIATSPGTDETTKYVLAGLPLTTTPVLQIPPDAQGLKLLTPELQARAKAEGIAVWVWPVDPAFDTKADYTKILAFEPNGIIVGRPADLVEVLKTAKP